MDKMECTIFKHKQAVYYLFITVYRDTIPTGGLLHLQHTVSNNSQNC